MSADLPSRKIRDIRGERFGRLLVESFSHISTDKGHNAYWTCLCDCGNTHTVSSSSLRAGSCTSCGCYAAEVSRSRIKQTHQKGRHLYFIRSGDYVKIGRADKVSLRLGQIRSANPHGAELLHVVENGGHLEHELHEKFKHRHHTGEWFILHDSEVLDIIDVQ